jgi:hypothetical protein
MKTSSIARSASNTSNATWYFSAASSKISGAALALAKCSQYIGKAVLCRGPVERLTLARPDLQRVAKRRYRFVQLRGARLAHSDKMKRAAEFELAASPFQRKAFACELLERLTIGSNSFCQLRCPAVASTQDLERTAEIVLEHGPRMRLALTQR